MKPFLNEIIHKLNNPAGYPDVKSSRYDSGIMQIN